MDVANEWFIHNCLKINPTKTDLILVKSQKRQLVSQFYVYFAGSVILPSFNTKVLGGTVDSGLHFDTHVTAVVRRCYGTLGGMCKSARGLPKDVKKFIVEMLVFPHIR